MKTGHVIEVGSILRLAVILLYEYMVTDKMWSKHLGIEVFLCKDLLYMKTIYLIFTLSDTMIFGNIHFNHEINAVI